MLVLRYQSVVDTLIELMWQMNSHRRHLIVKSQDLASLMGRMLGVSLMSTPSSGRYIAYLPIKCEFSFNFSPMTAFQFVIK